MRVRIMIYNKIDAAKAQFNHNLSHPAVEIDGNAITNINGFIAFSIAVYLSKRF